ncbi:MAG: glycosyltransferase family 61 protein [Cyanobacteriota bacterium]|nr:glycosyltransferase family 61 protein [Cyanobacteriota bacterium]
MPTASDRWITALGPRWYRLDGHHDPETEPSALLQQSWSADHLLLNRSLIAPAALAPRTTYPIEAAEPFRAAIGTELQRMEHQHGCLQPVVAVRIEEAIHYQGCLYLHDRQSGRILGLYEQHRPFERHMSKCPTAIADLQAMVDQRIPIPQRGRRALILGSCGSRNYGHFLLDDLSRLYLYLNHLGGGYSHQNRTPRRIILPAFNPVIDERRTQAVRWLLQSCRHRTLVLRPRPASKPPAVELQPNRRCFRVKQVTFVSPASLHPFELHAGAMIGLKQAAQRTLSRRAPESPPRRLFISRRNNRTILNLSGLNELLERAGFTTIYGEDLDFDGQRDLFAGADAVIGIMGAAMCNLIFAPEHCQVLFLAPEGWMDPLFHTLMASMMMDAHFIYCPVQPDADNPEVRAGQLQVPLASVQAWLAASSERSSRSSSRPT